MMHLTLTPAYGRDYTSRAKVLADLVAGRDFIVQPQGCYITVSEIPANVAEINVRYKERRSVAVFKVAELRKALDAS